MVKTFYPVNKHCLIDLTKQLNGVRRLMKALRKANEEVNKDRRKAAKGGTSKTEMTTEKMADLSSSLVAKLNAMRHEFDRVTDRLKGDESILLGTDVKDHEVAAARAAKKAERDAKKEEAKPKKAEPKAEKKAVAAPAKKPVKAEVATSPTTEKAKKAPVAKAAKK